MKITDDMQLRKLQAYVWQKIVDRGFGQEPPERKLLMLMEESGELAKAVRKAIGMGFAETTETTNIKEELADVQIVLLALASALGVDMLDAVRQKEYKNDSRHWNR